MASTVFNIINKLTSMLQKVVSPTCDKSHDASIIAGYGFAVFSGVGVGMMIHKVFFSTQQKDESQQRRQDIQQQQPQQQLQPEQPEQQLVRQHSVQQPQQQQQHDDSWTSYLTVGVFGLALGVVSAVATNLLSEPNQLKIVEDEDDTDESKKEDDTEKAGKKDETDEAEKENDTDEVGIENDTGKAGIKDGHFD